VAEESVESAAAGVQIGKTPEQPYILIYSRAEFAAGHDRREEQGADSGGSPRTPAGLGG
jgi:hypothetical protein